jgi:predicted RNA-binding Zn-ribbon protein involved in translation (DUF1610 family)
MELEFNSYGTASCGYFEEEWRTRIFTCPKCGWSGTHEDMTGPNHDYFLIDYECPECEKMMLILHMPTRKELCEKALAGNERARQAWRFDKSVREYIAFRRKHPAWVKY